MYNDSIHSPPCNRELRLDVRKPIKSTSNTNVSAETLPPIRQPQPLLITTLTLCLIFLLLSIFTEEHTVITYELKMIEDINDLHRYLSSTSSSDKNGFVHFTKDGVVAYHNDHNDNEAVGEHVERKTLENALNIGEGETFLKTQFSRIQINKRNNTIENNNTSDKILLRQELYDEINEDFLILCYETCFNDEEYPSPESKADEIGEEQHESITFDNNIERKNGCKHDMITPFVIYVSTLQIS